MDHGLECQRAGWRSGPGVAEQREGARVVIVAEHGQGLERLEALAPHVEPARLPGREYGVLRLGPKAREAPRERAAVFDEVQERLQLHDQRGIQLSKVAVDVQPHVDLVRCRRPGLVGGRGCGGTRP